MPTNNQHPCRIFEISLPGNRKTCINVDNATDFERVLCKGARELSAAEIARYGMAGFERFVCPSNTVVEFDGNIIFTPPGIEDEPETDLFASLRAIRNSRLSAYDNAISQLNRELRLETDQDVKAAIATKIQAWDTYAQALCDLPSQPDAPWDGGGPETPWPETPEI